jgi:hypothetical protein
MQCKSSELQGRHISSLGWYVHLTLDVIAGIMLAGCDELKVRICMQTALHGGDEMLYIGAHEEGVF